MPLLASFTCQVRRKGIEMIHLTHPDGTYSGANNCGLLFGPGTRNTHLSRRRRPVCACTLAYSADRTAVGFNVDIRGPFDASAIIDCAGGLGFDVASTLTGVGLDLQRITMRNCKPALRVRALDKRVHMQHRQRYRRRCRRRHTDADADAERDTHTHTTARTQADSLLSDQFSGPSADGRYGSVQFIGNGDLNVPYTSAVTISQAIESGTITVSSIRPSFSGCLFRGAGRSNHNRQEVLV